MHSRSPRRPLRPPRPRHRDRQRRRVPDRRSTATSPVGRLRPRQKGEDRAEECVDDLGCVACVLSVEVTPQGGLIATNLQQPQTSSHILLRPARQPTPQKRKATDTIPGGRTSDDTAPPPSGRLECASAPTGISAAAVVVRSRDRWADRARLDLLREVLAVPEPSGANVLLVGETVVVSASAPRTAELIVDRGWAVRTVRIDELERVEAGRTFLSVLLP